MDADRLLARYRPSRSRGAAPAPPASAGRTPEATLGGSSEIWRLEAEGNVRISTATDTARGDRAVYDIDQAVLVLTGRALSLSSAQQVITARDSLEYWSARRMAVARGDALVVDRQEDRRIRADTLVAYFLEDAPGSANASAGPARPPPVRRRRRHARRARSARRRAHRPGGSLWQCGDPHRDGGGARRPRRVQPGDRHGPAARRGAHHPR